MKRTTYKKIGPFLEEVESNGVIRLGASKDGNDHCDLLKYKVQDNPHLIRFKKNWRRWVLPSLRMQNWQWLISSWYLDMRLMLFILIKCGDGSKCKYRRKERHFFKPKNECQALIHIYIEKEDLTDPVGKGRMLVNVPLRDVHEWLNGNCFANTARATGMTKVGVVLVPLGRWRLEDWGDKSCRAWEEGDWCHDREFRVSPTQGWVIRNW